MIIIVKETTKRKMLATRKMLLTQLPVDIQLLIYRKCHEHAIKQLNLEYKNIYLFHGSDAHVMMIITNQKIYGINYRSSSALQNEVFYHISNFVKGIRYYANLPKNYL